MMFADKVSLITGASQGIGEAIALAFAAEGATVVLVDVQKAKLEAVAAGIAAAGGRASIREADVSRYDQASAAVDSVLAEFKRIDHLINNAGITRDNLLMRMKEDEWDAVLAVNLKGVFNFCKAAVRSMLGARGGRIVNLASVVGQMGNAGQTNYAAAKAGLIGFTKSLAREGARHKITVNCVCPGPTDTPLFHANPERMREALLKAIPFRRLAKPEDIAGAILYFAGPTSDYVTGQILSISGGLTMAG